MNDPDLDEYPDEYEPDAYEDAYLESYEPQGENNVDETTS